MSEKNYLNLLNNQSSKKQNLVCDICNEKDDYILCNECFGKFDKEAKSYMKQTKEQNDELKKSIEFIYYSNKKDIEKYNRICKRNINIENLKRLINIKKNKVELVNENIEIIIKNKDIINSKFNDTISKIDEIKKNSCEILKNQQKMSDYLNNTNLNKIKFVKIYMTKLLKFLFSGSIYKISEIFQKDEYSSLNLGKKIENNTFDEIPNILSTKYKHSNYDQIEEDQELFLEKNLKITQIFNNYKLNPFQFTICKNLKENERIYEEKLKLYEINIYIQKIMMFCKLISKFLAIKIPCENFDVQNMTISDNSDFSSKIKKIFIRESFNSIEESDIFSGYLTLERNLNLIKDNLGIKYNKEISKNIDISNILNMDPFIKYCGLQFVLKSFGEFSLDISQNAKVAPVEIQNYGGVIKIINDYVK